MKTPTIILAFLYCPVILISQIVVPKVLNAGGGLIQNNNIAISYSIGEPVVSTLGSGFPLITQGFEQPDSILQLQIVDLVDFDPLVWELKLYPNPALDFLLIEYNHPDVSLEATLMDFSGKVMFSKSYLMSDVQNQINIQSLPSGTYLIRLANAQQQFAVFQFVKINH